MSEWTTELAARLVIGRRRDGRCVYDAEAKRELVLASRRPGVSISRLARDCGINANQLSTWVRQHERQMGKAALRLGAVVDEPGPTFLPVQIEARPQGQERETSPLTVRASLPNGVILDLCGCDVHQAGGLIEALGRVRCSASTKD